MTLSHIILIFLLVTASFASDISAKYRVTFGFIGEIGVATTKLHVEGKEYKITIHAKTTGIAKFLSGDREEWYVSSGSVIKDGILLPNFYEKTVQRYSNVAGQMVLKKDIKKYIFLHEEKRLYKEITKIRGKEKVIHKEGGDYYASNDLLSLFFNFKKMLPSLDVKTPSVFYAVGANKTDGRIDILPLKKDDDLDWKSGHLMKVVVNDDIFSSDKGELLINLRDDGICKQAILKDVLFFGDIKGEMID